MKTKQTASRSEPSLKDTIVTKDKGKRVMFDESVQQETMKETEPNRHKNEMQNTNQNTEKMIVIEDEKEIGKHPSQHLEIPEGFNYEDPLLIELLDKNWDKECNTKQGQNHSIIEDIEATNNIQKGKTKQ
ncbi:hypothetical protein Salat_0592800 [Sesamum alatum]|uniref:Uncharacterized protein n=1 Tax=Sesamum alatum TaxID=300844 RepID=A0AAE2CTU6_9LAMI|nr:hypothetical protein Salat_0592800 [Sesamum alatum]